LTNGTKTNNKITARWLFCASAYIWADMAAITPTGNRSVKKICALLCIITFLIYANTLQNGFALDDVTVTTGNTIVTKGISGIPGLLTTPRLKGYEQSKDAESYRPVPLITSAIEYQLFGESPASGHFFNVLFFIGCVLSLFLLLNKLFAEYTGVAFLTALLFALHPVHTEVVANIKSRDELLCFFFAFASLNAFVDYARGAKIMSLASGALLLFVAFLSKETVISFVFIVPLVFFFYANDNKQRSTIIAGVTVGVAAAFLALRAAILPAHDHSTIAFISNPLVTVNETGNRIATALLVLGMYLKLMFLPYPLISDYSYNTIPVTDLSNIYAVLAMVAYGAVLAIAGYRLLKKKKDPWAFAILFFLGTIALFSNIPFFIYSQMAERFAFFASAGACMAIALACNKWLINAGAPAMQQKKTMMLIVPVCLVFAALTFMRNTDWKDNHTLFAADLPKAPNNAYLNYYLANEIQKNEAALPQQQADEEAIKYLTAATVICPGFDLAHAALGTIYDRRQQFDSSIVHNRLALTANPQNSIASYNLARAYFVKKNYPEAIASFKKTITLQPDVMLAHLNLALCYFEYKMYDSAILYFNNTLAIDPNQQLAQQGILQARGLKTQQIQEMVDSRRNSANAGQ